MSFPWKLSLPNHVCSCFGHTVEDLKVVNFKLITSQGAHTIGCVADCYFIVNVLDLPFASPIAIYR